MAGVLGMTRSSNPLVQTFALVLLVVQVHLLIREAEAADEEGGFDVLCPCLTTLPQSITYAYVKPDADGKECLMYTPPAGGEYCYPLEYGTNKCNTWDVGMPPDCADEMSAPQWCEQKWCYVDPAKCELEDEDSEGLTSSFFFGKENELFFSYKTCGGENEIFAKHARAAVLPAKELVSVVEEYVREAQQVVEKEYSRIQDSEADSNCPHTDSCKC